MVKFGNIVIVMITLVLGSRFKLISCPPAASCPEVRRTSNFSLTWMLITPPSNKVYNDGKTGCTSCSMSLLEVNDAAYYAILIKDLLVPEK